MQDNVHPSLSWMQIAFGIIASFIGGGGAYKLFNIWLNRKKPASEIVVNEAQAVKTRAEARKIGADADVQFNQIIENLHKRIENMQMSVEKIRSERDQYKLRCDLQEIELFMSANDIKRMKGILDAHGIKLSKFDEPKGD